MKKFCLKVSSNNNNSCVPIDDLSINNSNTFTTNAFLDLETKVYGDNWSIPYKRLLNKSKNIFVNKF